MNDNLQNLDVKIKINKDTKTLLELKSAFSDGHENLKETNQLENSWSSFESETTRTKVRILTAF